jgi:integrase
VQIVNMRNARYGGDRIPHVSKMDVVGCALEQHANRISDQQLMLGHSDIKTTQRYLNITDEEVRKALTGVWERRRQLKVVSQ